MRRSHLVIGALVVIVGALLAWKLRCGAGDSSEDVTGESAGASGTTLRGDGKRGPAGAPATPASLSGRVTRKSDGAGIAGAVVSIARTELIKELAPDNEPSTVVTTDASGGWTVPAIAPSTYTIGATAVGFVPGLRDRLVVAAGTRTTVDLVLGEGGTTIAGIVSDVGGGPIGAARVTVRREAFLAMHAELVALSGADGRYQLTLADGEYTATASHEDYTTVNRSFELQGERLAVDFVLTPGAQIRGQVVSRDGKPVPAAFVHAGGGRGRGGEQVIADASGNFTLKGLGTGAISLTAAARGFASHSPTVVEVGIGEQVEGVRIVLDRAFSVSGRLVRAGKVTEGVAGIRVVVFAMATQQYAQAIDPTDDSGAFEVIGVKPGNYMVFAMGEGVVPEIGKTVDVVDQDVTDLVIEMATGATLSGRVEPGTVAAVSIEPASDRIGVGNMFEMIKAAMVRADSDETGAFTLRSVPPGEFKLVARASDGRQGKLAVKVTAVDQANLVVPLEPRASIAGRVVDANGAPVVGVHVHVQQDAGRMEMSFSMNGVAGGSAVTGANGAFRAVGLEAGKHEVHVSDDHGRIPWARGDKQNEPQTFELARGQAMTGVTLAIEARDGVIRGVVVGPDRKPAADAWVTPRRERASSDSMDLMMQFTNPSQPILTNAEGKFAIERLRRGSYELIAEGPRGASRTKQAGVKPGETVTLVLEPLGTLSGTVTVNGKPVPEFDLECNPKELRDRLDRDDDTARRFANGTYTLERLVPGEYTCTATADAGNAAGKVTISSGPAKLDLAVAPWASITGSIVSVFDDKPVPGINVIATAVGADQDAFGDLLTGKAPKSDANGRFVVERVAAGKGKLGILPREGFNQLASRDYTALSGQRVDVGAIKIVPPRTGDAGTLGLNLTNDEAKLTVASVMPEGPAEQAGVARGDRVMSIDGKPVAELGLEIAQGYLFAGSVAVGQRVQLGLERAGKPLAVTLVAAKW